MAMVVIERLGSVGRPPGNRVFGVTHNIQYPCKDLVGDVDRYPSQRMDQPSALLTCRSKIGKIETLCFRRKCMAD
jgi:hypothetical protein